MKDKTEKTFGLLRYQPGERTAKEVALVVSFNLWYGNIYAGTAESMAWQQLYQSFYAKAASMLN